MTETDAMSERVSLSTDRRALSCTATILPGALSKSPDAFIVEAVLEAQLISRAAFDFSAIEDLVSRAEADPRSEHSGIVARGTAPVDGTHAAFTLAPSLLEQLNAIDARREHLEIEDGSGEQAPEPSASSSGEDDPVDFRAQSAFVVVRAGDVLGTLTEASTGEDGIDVRGEAIPAKSGRSLRLSMNSSTTKKNGTIVAAVDGVLEYGIDRLKIQSTLTIPGDVDYSTGNLDFPGSIVVHGGVKDQFCLKSSGSIRVEHLVEAADIHAGGDLSLPQGMAGRDTGTILVNGDLHAGYLDCVTGTIDGCCEVSKEIKGCRIAVGRRVESPTCAFYGGEITAGSRIELNVLGSNGGVETSVKIGTLTEVDGLVQKLGGILGQIVDQRSSGETELGALNDAISKLTAMQAERLTELQFEQIRADEMEQKLAKASSELLAILRGLGTPTLSVRRTLHKGVQIQIRHVKLVIKDTVQGPLIIDLDEHGSARCYLNGSQEPTPIGSIATLPSSDETDPIELLTQYAERAADADAASDAA